MAFVVRSPDQLPESTAQKVVEIEDCKCCDDEKQGCPESVHDLVTTKLYLKSTSSNKKMEKEHVMRRIRHRRRVNKARSFVQRLMGSTGQTGGAEREHKTWLDDAFSAP
ncbi:hypothetical protein Sjap_010475 [Stephania japonica]|uniref:Uncharacterized protein n=1 Tax=Stephania japonica TaxID=461633 RepID=A0AAP0J9N8_9MAGN